MAILTIAQTRSFAAKAGFTGYGLDTIVAIAQAESQLNTAARGVNTDGSVDRGIVQINNKWHAEYSDACAYDPACAMSAAYRISNRGTNFTPWSTFTSGAYKQYLSTSSGSGGTTAITGKQWYQYPLTNGYLTSYQGPGTDSPHYAVDLGAPMRTPFYFLESGTITQADYADWGGEVFMRPDKGGSQEYVYHLDEILPQDKPGKHVSAGEMIGYSGGQTSGGKHPTSSKWSTGPHIHFGLFDKYINTVVGSRPYGPSPVPLINQAKASNLTGFTGNGGDSTGTDTSSGTDTTSSTGISLADQVHQLLIEFPGFVGVAVALDQAEQFPGVKWYVNSSDPNPLNQVGDSIRSVLDTIVSNTLPLMLRSLFVAIGLLLLVGLLWNLVQSTGLADKAVNAAIGGMVAA